MAQYKGFPRRRKCRVCSSRKGRLCLSSHRLRSVIPPMFHACRQILLGIALNRVRYNIHKHWSRFGSAIDRVLWVLPATAGTKKHGCSAESPSATCRAAMQFTPLEGRRDSRGSAAAIGRRSRSENTRHNAIDYVMQKILPTNIYGMKLSHT